MLLGQSRVFYSMSRDGLLPKLFCDIHPKFRTPWRSNLLFMVFVSLFSAFAPIRILGEATSIGTLFAFVLVCGGIIIMRRTHPELPRPFKTPFVPVVPILGIGFNLVLMYGLGWTNWARLFGWMAIGLVIYFGYSRKHSTPEPAAPGAAQRGQRAAAARATGQPSGHGDPTFSPQAAGNPDRTAHFVQLSSTSPLLQAWSSRRGSKLPYRFFALSNAGALAGLLLYPVLGPNPLSRCGNRRWPGPPDTLFSSCFADCPRGASEAPQAEALPPRLIWLVLAACPSALLLSVTNLLTQNVAPIPFLWVPLGLIC